MTEPIPLDGEFKERAKKVREDKAKGHQKLDEVLTELGQVELAIQQLWYDLDQHFNLDLEHNAYSIDFDDNNDTVDVNFQREIED